MGDIWATRIEDYHMARKSKQAKKSKPKRAKIDPIPKGFRTVTPYLSINGAAAAIDWYKKAFGAREIVREPTPDGKLMHAQIRIGDSILMMSDVFPGASSQSPDVLGNSPVTLQVYVKNVDKLWHQAVDAGAKVTLPLGDQFWGERYGQLQDPFGHNWSISQRVPMSRQEMKQKQEQAMARFAQGEHPGRPEQVAMTQE